MYAARFAVACATATVGASGSLAYGSSGGGAARCEGAPARRATGATGGTTTPDDGAPAGPVEKGVDRYLGYTAALARLKVVLLKTKVMLAKKAVGKAATAKAAAAEGARYVAYSSDVGESMRPVLKPWMVNATYGIAVGYVGYDAYSEVRRKADLGHGNDVLFATCAHKLVFHAAVSLALPAVIIHTAVHRRRGPRPAFA